MTNFGVFVLVFVTFSIFSGTLGYKQIPKPEKVICSRNEEYLECGRPCQTECDTLGKKCPVEKIKCTKGCYCKAGYARIKSGGPCVSQDKCNKAACLKNEIWLECGQAPACQRWCDKLDIGCFDRPASCKPGWYCKKGYARDRKNKKCIKIKDCPSNK